MVAGLIKGSSCPVRYVWAAFGVWMDRHDIMESGKVDHACRTFILLPTPTLLPLTPTQNIVAEQFASQRVILVRFVLPFAFLA